MLCVESDKEVSRIFKNVEGNPFWDSVPFPDKIPVNQNFVSNFCILLSESGHSFMYTWFQGPGDCASPLSPPPRNNGLEETSAKIVMVGARRAWILLLIFTEYFNQIQVRIECAVHRGWSVGRERGPLKITTRILTTLRPTTTTPRITSSPRISTTPGMTAAWTRYARVASTRSWSRIERSFSLLISKQVEKVILLRQRWTNQDDKVTFINEDSDNDDASLAAKSVESDVSLQSISSEELLETLRLR